MKRLAATAITLMMTAAIGTAAASPYDYAYNNGYGNSGYANGGINITSSKLVGGLVGGALGNLVGKGDGRKAATIAGAVIGYNVAGAAQRNRYGYDKRYYNNAYNGAYNSGDYGYGNGYNAGYVSTSYRYEDGPYGRGYYDYARVVNVDPIVEVVNQPVRSQRCYGGNDGYGYDGNGYNSGYNGYYGHSGVNGGKLLGGLIGGALGNSVGKGDGRKATTIAGAVAGYAIAGAVQRDNRYDRSYGNYDRDHGYWNNSGYGYGDQGYYNDTRCEVDTDYRRDRRVVGYDVTYDYRGRIQHVRSVVDPGSRIRVRVDVRPEI